MFEQFKLLGNTERKIALETRRGKPIKNAIDLPPTRMQVEKYQRLFRKHPRWQERVAPVGGYNCLGHVWASRRTGIFDEVESQIRLVFEDDGYRVLVGDEKPRPGDLTAYWTAPGPQGSKRVFLHVGMIIELRELGGGSAVAIPWVLSKWDSTSGEVIHRFDDVEFGMDYQCEIWTERD